MKINSNLKYSTILGISHFLTDSITAFALTYITINSINTFGIDSYLGIQIAGYFLLYNFLAFFLQIFLGYFLDKLSNTKRFFEISKKLVIISFLFYILGSLLLTLSYTTAISLIGLGSCLFHLGAGNIAIISNKNKASYLGIFASGGVIGLSFGAFYSLFLPELIIVTNLILIIIVKFILTEKNYEIEKEIKTNYYNLSEKGKDFIYILVFLLMLVLVIRSSIWTNFQSIFIDNKWILFFIAIFAFFGKITGGFLEDYKNFKEKYFIITTFISILFIIAYSYFYQNIMLLLIGIFGIQLLISPITIIIYKLIPNKKSEIIGFTFGFSLVLGYLFLTTF